MADINVFITEDSGIRVEPGESSELVEEAASQAQAAAAEATAQVALARAASETVLESTVGSAKVIGTRTNMPTTSTASSGFLDTLILNQRIGAGSILNAIDLVINTSGVGAINLMVCRRNADGTADLIADLDDQVASATGTVSLPLQSGGADYLMPEDGYLAIRRAVSTAGRYAWRSENGTAFLVSGKLAGPGATAAFNAVTPAYQIAFEPARRSAQNFDQTALLRSDTGRAPQKDVLFSQNRFERAAGSVTSNEGPWIVGEAIKRSGLAKSFRMGNVTAIGMIDLILLSPDADNWKVEAVIPLQATTTGPVTWNAGTDFPSDIEVERGWKYGFRLSGAQVAFGGSNTGYSLQLSTALIQEGQSYSASVLNFSFDLEITIQTAPVPLSTLVETFGERRRGSTVEVFERFGGTATPSDWTLGNWTVSDGLLSPTSAGTSSFARVSLAGWTTRHFTRCRLRVATASSTYQIGIGGNESGSQLVRINAQTQQIDICKWAGVGGAPSVQASRDIGFTDDFGSVAGRRYTFEVRRKANAVSIVLIDTTNHERFEWAIKGNAFGRINGDRGVLFQSGPGGAGDVVVEWFEAGIDVAPEVFAIFAGDSNTDGFGAADVDQPSWAERIDAARNNGDTLTVAKFGATSSSFLPQLQAALDAVDSVRYVAFMIGTNDTVQGTLDANIASIIAAIEAKGAIPVLVTMPPKGGGLYATTNANIRSGVYGAYPFVDVASALTASNDLTNWNNDFQTGDGIHINGAGHEQLASSDAFGSPRGQFAVDAPFLFEGSLAGVMPVIQ